MTRWVGAPVAWRPDVLDKVTGSAIYGADLKLPGMLHGKVLRSPYAHARIVSLDLSRALELPGVVAVATGDDVEGLCGEAIRDMPFLAKEKVRYVGEPVAAVAAVTESVAEQALGLIDVRYDRLQGVFDPVDAARDGAPLVHERLDEYARSRVAQPVPGTNIVSVSLFEAGDVERGFQESDYVFEDTFRSHVTQHAQIEPHFAIAVVQADGRITLWTPTNAPHRHRKELADALGIPLSKIRVVVPYTGGNFGGKSGPRAEGIAVSLAMKARGRPVRVVFTRDEVFQATRVRHAAVITVKTGVRRDGTLWARKVVGYWDTGAYADRGPSVVHIGTMAAMGPYRIPNVRLKGYCVYTNKHPAGGLRGYGTPQPTWAYERQMDLIARALGMDPVELRLKNALREGDAIPSTGEVAHSVGITDCIEQVAQALEWGKPRTQYRGRGIACTMKGTKTPSGSAAFVVLNQDGTVNIITSAVEQGQGVKTVLAQLAAEELGVPVERITVSDPDTDVTPYDASSTASRTTFHMGNAVCQAARDLKVQLAQVAAQVLDCSVEQVVVERGLVMRGGDPSSAIGYGDLVARWYGAGGTLVGRAFFYPETGKRVGMYSTASAFWMYGACGAEVEVDPETGRMQVLRLVAAHDVGKAINPVTCSGQIEGGMVHGMSIALYENVLVDDGRVLNPSFKDYKIATALDVPKVPETIIVEASHRQGPHGAKGVGEPVVSPVAPAIANAISDAVGVSLNDQPMTAELLFRAIRQSGERRESG